jgi:hypothetical protein
LCRHERQFDGDDDLRHGERAGERHSIHVTGNRCARLSAAARQEPRHV